MDANRDDKGWFIQGNRAAEKWTKKEVVNLLTQMWDKLTADELGEAPEDKNYVRANDIKTIHEICLMFDLDSDTWAYLKTKFQEDKSVLRLFKKIINVLEARLIYSGQTMDIFVLKNHYGYEDKQQREISGELNTQSLSDTQFSQLLKTIRETSSNSGK